jgi:hypothetical protein
MFRFERNVNLIQCAKWIPSRSISMQNWKGFSRVFFLLALLTSLLAGISAPALGNQSASAAPMQAPQFACPATTIAQWTFTNTVIPSTGNGQFLSGIGITPLVPPGTYQFLVSAPSSPSNPSIYFGSWNTAALDPNDYLEFQVDTSGYSGILFNFDYRSTGTGPVTLEIHYSTDGTNNFTYFSTVTPLLRDSAFNPISVDLSSIPALDNNINAKFRIYAYGGGAGNFGRQCNHLRYLRTSNAYSATASWDSRFKSHTFSQ